jgi:hypothetical protein
METVFYGCMSLLALVIAAIGVKLLGRQANGLFEVIKLAKEKESLEHDLGNILLFIVEAKKGHKHTWLDSGDSTTNFIARELYNNFEVIKEHFKK